mmetsp:Transcript_109748/g.245175  ORF Transcript_109748/g.245175 Transcript_109748/m.245175 type:complete len:305 (-) Transcript_109748:751-1665(-)
MLDHLVLLDELRMLRVQWRVKVGLRCACEPVHELEDSFLLINEEPLDALTNILHPPLQWQVRFVAEELHDYIAPSKGAHGDAPRLDHVPLFCLYCDLGETQEDLDLVHKPPELCATIHLHIEGGNLDLVAEVVDIVRQPAEILGGEHAEVAGPQGLVVGVELFELVLEVHDGFQVEDPLHDVSQSGSQRDTTITGGAEDPLWVGVVVLSLKLATTLPHCIPHRLQIREHRTERVSEEPLDFPLHKRSEGLEADGLHKLGAEALRLHLRSVLLVLLLLEGIEGLGTFGAILPPGQGQGEADQALG